MQSSRDIPTTGTTEHLIERTGVGRDREGPGGLRPTVGIAARGGVDPTPEIGETETEDDPHGTANEIGTVTETETEIETDIDDPGLIAEVAGRKTTAGLLGPVRLTKLHSLSNRRGKSPVDLLRSRGWPLRLGKDTTALSVRRLPLRRSRPPRSTMAELVPSYVRLTSVMCIPSERAI